MAWALQWVILMMVADLAPEGMWRGLLLWLPGTAPPAHDGGGHRRALSCAFGLPRAPLEKRAQRRRVSQLFIVYVAIFSPDRKFC